MRERITGAAAARAIFNALDPAILKAVSNAILSRRPLGAPPWVTIDPFLFCVHHVDAYPAGNPALGPDAPLAGRQLGMDFEGKDGWRMYHGEQIPGFPQHPHRGFETVTILRRGIIDHSDSLGAAARFGKGDVQWMTAGRGVVHSEMFPLLSPTQPNPLELFQIWINLPKESKFVEPHFSMFWERDIPTLTFGPAGAQTEVTVIAGELDGRKPPAPPPHSWAARPDAGAAIWTIRMEPGAAWELPPAALPSVMRSLYFFAGSTLKIDGEELKPRIAAVLDPERALKLEAGDAAVDCLLLQARPIAQPVAHYGPFVMNTQEELRQAVSDYQRTRFGGWPWPSDAPVHPREETRFARHADGRIERPEP